MPTTSKRPKPDGRYSTVFAAEPSEPDAWEAITAVESPTAIATEPPKSRKRSGEYARHAFADAMKRAAADEP